jgi:hypothetical protein
MTRLAICVGLTKLNPDYYDGWDGACPGCDRDASRFATLCHNAGFDGITCLINQAATQAGVESAFAEAASDLRDGDLLTFYNSGHGGQQRDSDGDEEDRQDETLCWWDGEIIDDQIAFCLKTLRKCVRVLFVTDTCNSGTNYRGRGRVRRSTPKRVHVPATDGFNGTLLHFGGCADGRSSYGSDQGGEFTIALLDVLSKARKPLNYTEGFDRAAKRMPRYQKPVFAPWGSPNFHDREALT